VNSLDGKIKFKVMRTSCIFTGILCLVLVCQIAAAGSSNCLDNTKKIAVYLPSTDVVAHDPICTAMFFEYNLDYLTDSTITSNLTKKNYELLLVPDKHISDKAATAVNKYLNSGGKVWFFADPRLKPDGSMSDNRINILGKTSEIGINRNSNFTVDNTDPITNGLSRSYRSMSTTNKSTYARSFNPDSGNISGFKYKVLASVCKDGDMLIRFENPKTGAKAIYSNENMFISGGSCNYFNRYTATRLFQNSKNWILGLDKNTYGISITYPKGDKQVTVTIDDVMGADKEIPKTRNFFEMEKSKKLANVQDMNTFFIVPESQTSKSGLAYFSKYGDTHTIHPHRITDWRADFTVAQFQKNITKAQSIMNKAAGVPNYGFSSIRFPNTAASVPAYQAASNAGFIIDSTYGYYTSMTALGDTQSNNVFFPKQKILYGKETNTIEIEVPGYFDISPRDANDFYRKNAACLKHFKGINFPANFIIAGHIQGMMTKPDLFSNMSKTLDYIGKNTGYTVFSTLDQIAKYNDALKSTKIQAYNTPKGVTVDITTSKQIDNFTIKLTNVKKGVKAQYDGTDNCDVIHADGVYYVYHTVSPGTHQISVTTA
jgi:hypothetical protein